MSVVPHVVSRTRPAAWLVVAAVSWIAFVTVGLTVVLSSGTHRLDQLVANVAAMHRGPVVTQLMVFITSLGAFPVVVAVALIGAAVLWWRTQRPHASIVLLCAVAMTACVVYLLKIAVGRARPSIETLIGTPSTDYAFPSGHTTNGTVAWVLAVALIASTLQRRLGRAVLMIIGATIAVLVGVSRVYLGFHWASDVLGGWLLATVMICAATYVLDRLGLGSAPDPDQLIRDHRAASSTHRVTS